MERDILDRHLERKNKLRNKIKQKRRVSFEQKLETKGRILQKIRCRNKKQLEL